MPIVADIERIGLPTSTRARTGETHGYVLDGEEPLLVDPAATDERLDRTIERTGIEHIAVTHTHPDHVGAVATYADRLDATLWARRGYEDRFEAAAGVAPDRSFVQGTTIGPATVLDTPGHAPDHVAFECSAQSEDDPEAPRRLALLVGDLAVAQGSVVVGAPDGDVRSYLTSLRRLRTHPAARWYPSHGPVIEEPLATAERLIAHRLEREQRIADAVRAGASTVDDILEAAYDKDLSGVADLARATVQAHLEKLAVEGTVRLEGDRIGVGETAD